MAETTQDKVASMDMYMTDNPFRTDTYVVECFYIETHTTSYWFSGYVRQARRLANEKFNALRSVGIPCILVDGQKNEEIESYGDI